MVEINISYVDIELNKYGGFKCLRPTTPENEDIFEGYSETRKNDFLSTLKSLKDDCIKASEEKNFKKASEILIDKQFGSRFPKGEDKDEQSKSNTLKESLALATIKPKPYAS